MKPETPLKSGDEYDAFCARQWHFWKPGAVKKIQRRYWKRVRRCTKAMLSKWA